MADSVKLREAGNEHFKAGKYQDALKSYTQALEAGNLKDQEKALVYKNRAACHLKLGDNLKAITDATEALELSPNDPKALFRRCQAYENDGKKEAAYKDAALLIKVDPNNKAARPIFTRLNTVVQDRIKQQNTTSSKISQMFNIAFDTTQEHDKRIQSLNNLIVLSREEMSAALMVKQSVVQKLKPLLFENQPDVMQGATRVLTTLAKDSRERSLAIIHEIDLANVLRLMSAKSEDMASSAALLLQNLITYSTGIDLHQDALAKHQEAKKKGERNPYPQLVLEEDAKTFLRQVFDGLVKMLASAKVTAFGRDSAIELITKNVTSKEGADWTGPFLDTQGLENLLTVAGTQKEFKTIPITDKSAMHASVALSKIYDDLINDKLRDKFREKCQEFFRELFADDILESKIEAVAAVSTLLQGAYDVGSVILGLEGVTQLMFTLATTENRQYQRVAVEAIVSSASKKEKCSGLLKEAVPILKKLYHSGDDAIKVRALVGLCKLGSFGGTDASAKTMAEGSTEKLAKICRKFLVNTEADSSDLGKWATEGLAYLTLDADIKEDLVNDTDAIKAIFKLAKATDRNSTYAAVTVIVNLTNSYDKQDVMPELLELAKFAKQHVPQEHAKDKHEFVSQRLHKLASAGVVNAMVALTDTDSKNSRELLSRVYIALATEEKLRGLIVQQGGSKSLLRLMDNNTDVGSVLASHALAKIAVTHDPNFAFPGQRAYEVVRPLLSLLHPDRSGLQAFEAMMGLTNLASMSESVRNRIISEKGLSSIEHYMFEDHQMLRRAATECMCNMVMSEKVQEIYEGDNDKIKLLVLFSGEDDIHLVRAATGALAVLSERKSVCEKIVAVKPWMDIFQVRVISELPDIQHRACHIVMNITQAGKDLATHVVEGPMMEILMAVSKQNDPGAEAAQRAAQATLESAKEYGLIQEVRDGQVPGGLLETLREKLRQAAAEEERKRKEEEEEEERQKKEEEEESKRRLEQFDDRVEKAQQSRLAEEDEGEEEEEEEEIIVDRPDEVASQLEDRFGGVKIREITDEEEMELNREKELKKKKLVVKEVEEEKKVEEEKSEKTENVDDSKKDDGGDDNDIDEEELGRGDVWEDESGIPKL